MEAGNAHPPAWSRPWRRLVRPFLNKAERRQISRAIESAELKTAAPIRVEILARSGGRDLLELARIHFRKHPSENGHGVLILIAHLDHRFAIWGEEGIHSKAGQPLWQKAARTLSQHFARRLYAEGIEACVKELGEELAAHFPRDRFE